MPLVYLYSNFFQFLIVSWAPTLNQWLIQSYWKPCHITPNAHLQQLLRLSSLHQWLLRNLMSHQLLCLSAALSWFSYHLQTFTFDQSGPDYELGRPIRVFWTFYRHPPTILLLFAWNSVYHAFFLWTLRMENIPSKKQYPFIPKLLYYQS